MRFWNKEERIKQALPEYIYEVYGLKQKDLSIPMPGVIVQDNDQFYFNEPYLRDYSGYYFIETNIIFLKFPVSRYYIAHEVQHWVDHDLIIYLTRRLNEPGLINEEEINTAFSMLEDVAMNTALRNYNKLPIGIEG